MRKLKDYTPTKFMAEDSHYDKAAADYAVRFIECLAHAHKCSKSLSRCCDLNSPVPS